MIAAIVARPSPAPQRYSTGVRTSDAFAAWLAQRGDA